METFLGIMIPFFGTALGSACVFFMKKSLGDLVQRSLAGFAAGVMVAASIWSLLIPAIEQSEDMGKLSFLPAFIGFWVGVLFLLLLDRLIPHLHVGSEQAEGPKSKLGRTTMMVLAVTLHNIPEGMAVGVVYAGFLSGNTQITAASALALSLGIAIQNFPEGAIISMPLKAEGESKGKAFFGGVQEQEDEEELDPYFRPDAVSGEDEPDGLDWMPETPTEPCPCCGAEIPENPSWGYICPMCGWEIDYDVEGEPDKPSDQNHGLSLTEAQWNFHSFGTVAPWKVMEN